MPAISRSEGGRPSRMGQRDRHRAGVEDLADQAGGRDCQDGTDRGDQLEAGAEAERADFGVDGDRVK